MSKGKGDFTPGANLDQRQITRVLAFVACKDTTNDKTLANMAAFFTRQR